MSRALVIRRCATTEEAVVVVALLKDAGFSASLDNWNHAMVDWGSIAAFGGVGISVPSEQAIEAGNYMIEALETADNRLQSVFGDYDRSRLPGDRIRALSMLFIFLGGDVLVFLPIIWLLTLLPESWFVPTEDQAGEIYAQAGRAIGEAPDLSGIGDSLLFLAVMLTLLANEMFNARQSQLQRNTEERDVDSTKSL